MPSTESSTLKTALQPERLLYATSTLAATIASFCSLYAVSIWFGAGASAAILSAVLALTLSRRHIGQEQGVQWMELVSLPLMALAAAGIAWLLHNVILVGGPLLVLGIAGAIWLRRFGGEMQRLGTVITLPLVAILIVPVPVHAPGGKWVELTLVILAGVAALGWVWTMDKLARRMNWFISTDHPAIAPPERVQKDGQMAPSTRMAVQMAAALGSAFLLGQLVFGHHWRWVVITAFIVSSNSLGRSDAVYKGVLRLGGAMAGTALAVLLQQLTQANGITEAILIFSVLFVGIWLREVNYAFWACCITLVVALMQHTGEQQVLLTLTLRLVAILCGAICAIVAAWWVLPIKTEAVVRRYLADTLLALEQFAIAAGGAVHDRAHALRVFEHRLAQLERVAPPLAWHHRLTRAAADADHPAVWINIAREYLVLANNLQAASPELVRATRLARRTIGQREMPITTALGQVRGVLAGSH